MIKLEHTKDISLVANLENNIKRVILENLNLLDEYYGENHNVKEGLGEYVVIVENSNDIKEVTKLILDIIPEYVDLIEEENKKKYLSSLYLLNSDYAIVLIGPFKIAPKEMKIYL